ncbi:MAG TPA: hypothetical protein DCG28_00995 [Lachnospiraceae bacterium]|nr:hypothetical protein [Lachnospiraceae bacterium]
MHFLLSSSCSVHAQKRNKEKLWVNPDCGLKTRGTEETEKSLENMVKAAKNIRNTKNCSGRK